MANEPQGENNFYKPDTLFKAFGIASIVMMIATVWMIMDDYGREWKGYQREFLGIKKKKYEKLIEAQNATLDQKKIAEINAAIDAKEKDVKSKASEVEKLENELVKLQTKLKISTLKFQDEKLKWDVTKYEYEAKYGHEFAHHAAEELEEGAKKEKEPVKEAAPEAAAPATATPQAAATPETAKEAPAAATAAPEAPRDPKSEHEAPAMSAKEKAAYTKVLKDWDKVVALKNTASAAAQEVEAKEKELAAYKTEIAQLQKDLKIARGDLDRLQAAKDSAEITLMKVARNAPIVDMANPTLRIQQIVLPEIKDDIFFANVRKVDRCTTCHQAIDTPGFEDQPNPFKTHPKLDLMLGSRSPHPIDKIGCTVCHEGRGQAVEFSRSAHTPRNEEQKKEWEKKYGWHEQHHVIEKMLPLQYTEGKCRVCHRQTEYVPRAQKLTASNQLVKAAGCYGCHRIEGWDHIRKPAPSLKRVKGKLSRDWIMKWVANPRSFNDHARMPSSFFQSNVEGNEEFIKHQKAEVNAIVDYVISLSDDYTPNVRLSLGNADRGKEIFGSVGCLACHQSSDFERTRGRFSQAPDLSTVGSKVSKDWLTSWLKNPRHYWADTTMPSFRLSDSEISDVAAYLMSKKNPEFEAAKPVETDLEAQKAVLKLYLIRDPKMAPATAEKVDAYVAKLQSHEIPQKLGAFAMARYGCFGCHEVKGYEATQGIGTELTEWASKLTNKLDFGLLPLEKNHYTWLDAKLTNTRVYDKGIVKEYLDLLRMPQYGFNGHERETIITGLLGQTAQKIAAPTSKALSPRESLMEDGIRVVHKYNCQGCHVMEQLYQPMPDDHPMREEHEKTKYELEGRILAHYKEDETLGPPVIITEGKRVWPSWAHKFLNDPSNTFRYRLKVRMPTFQMSNEEINKIVTYWGNYGQVDLPFSEQKPVVSDKLAAGRELFNKLQCTSCHTVNQRATPAELADPGSSKGLAPDLGRAYGKVRKEWIMDMLRDPQKMVPGTRMPGFWPEGQSAVPEVLGGDAAKQIEAVADYVLSLGQGRN